MSMFACSLTLIDASNNQALYRFHPDQLHAKSASGKVQVNAADWSYNIIEPSDGESLGAVSSDAGCMYRLMPKLKALFTGTSSWPEEVRYVS
jgi:hypothetical protein